ncbi:TetR/AcrR family transcriptional regulator [Kribbella sp.]|uniref:TetR/AcrR family transcriptional regulator n=1 Tax=Kribbella sp. TaxID=1871183 RepID=UPI002D25F36E|nr:TetR/AcrR family transcriptional regulator [Kribbella sp.]HZX06265.1 TetR/AcrR family transcriptional regulator [Kribbella sp.]
MTVANRRARSPRGSGDDLRDALVTTTAELLETQDVDSLSVRTVTAATGVSPTALYLHFSDLPELLRAVKARFFGELRDRLTAVPGDGRDRVRALALAYLAYARQHVGRYAVMFHAHRRTDAPSRPDAELVELGWTAFEPLIDAVGAVLRDASPDEIRETSIELWLALHGRAQLSVAMPWFELPNEERYVDRLVRQVLG